MSMRIYISTIIRWVRVLSGRVNPKIAKHDGRYNVISFIKITCLVLLV